MDPQSLVSGPLIVRYELLILLAKAYPSTCVEIPEALIYTETVVSNSSSSPATPFLPIHTGLFSSAYRQAYSYFFFFLFYLHHSHLGSITVFLDFHNILLTDHPASASCSPYILSYQSNQRELFKTEVKS